MSIRIRVNGRDYHWPSYREVDWADKVVRLVRALADSTLQKNTDSFTLGKNLDFGSRFGLTVKDLTFHSPGEDKESAKLSYDDQGDLNFRGKKLAFLERLTSYEALFRDLKAFVETFKRGIKFTKSEEEDSPSYEISFGDGAKVSVKGAVFGESDGIRWYEKLPGEGALRFFGKNIEVRNGDSVGVSVTEGKNLSLAGALRADSVFAKTGVTTEANVSAADVRVMSGGSLRYSVVDIGNRLSHRENSSIHGSTEIRSWDRHTICSWNRGTAVLFNIIINMKKIRASDNHHVDTYSYTASIATWREPGQSWTRSRDYQNDHVGETRTGDRRIVVSNELYAMYPHFFLEIFYNSIDLICDDRASGSSEAVGLNRGEFKYIADWSLRW